MKKASVVIGIVLAVVAVVGIGLLVAGGLWLQGHGWAGPHMMRGWSGPLWGMRPMWGGPLLLLLLAAVGGAVALLVAGLSGRKGTLSKVEPTALDILKRRYAGGEIDREEYERMREELLK